MNDRKTAALEGRKRYIGKVCVKHPHLAGERYVASYGCVRCAVEAVQKNQQKIPAVIKARQAEYRSKNKDATKQRHRVWRSKNVAADAARKRMYIEKNREKVAARYKAYYTANFSSVIAKNMKRHADKLQRTPKWIGGEELWLVKEAYALAKLRARMFGFPWHVDHVLPLRGKTVSGLHVPENLQVIPGIDNLRKTNRV